MKTKVILIPAAILMGAAVFFACDKKPLEDDGIDLSALSDPTTNATQTTQSMMIGFEDADPIYYIPGGGEVEFEFDKKCAKDYFEVTDIQGCPPDGQENKLWEDPLGPIKGNICIFWNGGQLPAKDYTLSGEAKCSPSASKSAWSITISPKMENGVPVTVPPLSCWEPIGEDPAPGDGSVDVTFNITIAGESFMMSSNGKKNWDSKYSFTIKEKNPLYDPLNPTLYPEYISRIRDLQITLSDDNGTPLLGPMALDHTLVDGDASNDCLAEFLYFGNAGWNANAKATQTAIEKLHADLSPVYSGLPADLIENILLSDSFVGNDGVCDYVTIGKATWTFEGLEAGKYKVIVSGICKGVIGAADLPFTVEGGITIITPDECD